MLPVWLSIFMFLGVLADEVPGKGMNQCLWGHPRRRLSQSPLNPKTAQIVYGNHFYQLKANESPPRPFLLYTPQSGLHPDEPLPVVILLHPQSFDVLKHGHDNWEGILSLAAQERFAVIMLLGQNNIFNVGLNLKSEPGKADELTYLKKTLEHISQNLCVDKHRIFCLGLSNGGRLCQHFVSDFHDASFAAVGLVSSVRYPYPNHNLQPVPMIAVHGMDDGIDPYWGGGPAYWGQESVPQAIQEWSRFNGCQRSLSSESIPGVVIYRHTQCIDEADVVLLSVEGGGHTQPIVSMKTSRPTIRCGPHHLPVVYVNVTQVVWHFFLEHGAAAPSHAAKNSVAFQGNLSSAMSTIEVPRGVDMVAGQLPESAGQAQRSLSKAEAACMVTLLASITTALVSATLFFYRFWPREAVPADESLPTVRFMRLARLAPEPSHEISQQGLQEKHEHLRI